MCAMSLCSWVLHISRENCGSRNTSAVGVQATSSKSRFLPRQRIIKLRCLRKKPKSCPGLASVCPRCCFACGPHMESMSIGAALTRRLTKGSSSAAMMRMPAAEGCCASGMNISLIS